MALPQSDGSRDSGIADMDIAKEADDKTDRVKRHVHERIVVWARDDVRQYTTLDARHAMLKALLEGLLPKQMPAAGTLLHLFSGTALWCVEAAQAFPKAHLIGMDPCQTYYQGPLGTRLALLASPSLITDRPKLALRDQSVDLIVMHCAAPHVCHWPALLGEIQRVLTRGGKCHLVEEDSIWQTKSGAMLDGQMAKTPAWLWMQLCREATRALGRDPRLVDKLEGYCIQAGLVVESSKRFCLPFHQDDKAKGILKEASRLQRRILCEAVDAFGREAIEVLHASAKGSIHFGMCTSEEASKFCKDVKRQIRERNSLSVSFLSLIVSSSSSSSTRVE